MFTLDVFIGIVGQLCFTYCSNKTDRPLSQKSIISAKQILRYKNVGSFGKKRWDMLEHVNEEMEKLGKIRISLQKSQSRSGTVNHHNSHLIYVKTVKRDFNGYTRNYVASSWGIKPGQWAVYMMSKKEYEFIGKLSQTVFRYEHRKQRGSQALAKKLMYALFVLPGGTYYIKNGAKKSLKEYLKLVGEYRVGERHGPQDARKNHLLVW